MSREKLQKFGQDMLRVAVMILLLGGLMASALYTLNKVGVSGVWAVILAAALTLVFFAVFSRSPVLPTILVVAFSFGPTITVDLLTDAKFAIFILILLGLLVIALLIYALVRNPEHFKGKPGWWVPPAIFAVMFLALGILGAAGVLSKVPGFTEAIVFGCAAALCLFAGIWGLVEARKGTEWADTSSSILCIIVGVVLIAVTIIVVSVENNPGAKRRVPRHADQGIHSESIAACAGGSQTFKMSPVSLTQEISS